MTEIVRVGDIDVPQDLPYERRSYHVRLVFAVIFALVLVAGLLGLLGRSGPLSETTRSAGDVTVEYERFLRLKTPTPLRIALGGGEGQTNIAVSRGLLEDFRIQSSSVEPEDTTVLPDRVVYTFDQQPPTAVTFVLEPQEIGRHRGTIYGPANTPVDISQWVWP